MFPGNQGSLVEFEEFLTFTFCSMHHSQKEIQSKQFFGSHVYFIDFRRSDPPHPAILAYLLMLSFTLNYHYPAPK